MTAWPTVPEATSVVAEPPRMACAHLHDAGVPRARIDRMARGFNLPNVLEGAFVPPPSHETLAQLRALGFTHIRLPIIGDRLFDDRTPQTEVATRLRAIDEVLDRLLQNDFAVSLDLHPGGAFAALHGRAPEQAYTVLERTWRELARHFVRRDPDRVFFELLNEPNADREQWNRQAPRLVNAIRQFAPDHTIVFGPADYQRVEPLVAMTPLHDNNVVYAFHYYDPMVFTHQGLDWASTDPLRHVRRVPFPADIGQPSVHAQVVALRTAGHSEAARELESQLSRPWTESRIDSAIASVGDWSLRHRRAVIVNEFGVLASYAPEEDRARWIEAVRKAAERNCIGWTHWDYADGFGFMRRSGTGEIADPRILNALVDVPLSPRSNKAR